MAKQSSDFLLIGIGGHAVAIDRSTGTEIWRTKLKGSSFVTVSMSKGRVHAGAGGELFCLDASDGTLLWRNPLKGLGYGVIAFTGSADIVTNAAAAAAASAAATAAAS